MGPTFSNPPEIEIATAAATGVDPQLVTANPDTWTERVTTTPIPNIELQDWDGISSTQTADWSSGNTISTWCALTVAFYSITPSTQISRQPSQQLYAEQPSLWQEWEGYKSPSILPFFIPGMPRFIQASQRIEPLVDFNFIHWEQSRRWSTPTQFIPDSPLPHQGGQQLYFDLPNLWQEWEAYSPAPWAWRFTPPTPPLSHLIQRYIPLDDFDYTEWEQYRRWPVLVEVVPSVDSPTTRQASQVIINLPDFNSYWWDVAASALIRNNPLPSSFRISEEGVSGIYNLIANVSQIGKFRIQNARTGYVLYIGVNQIPIPSEGGTFVNTFSTTLPMSLAITGSLLPPIGEVWTYYIMVRAQDNYGLQSQNQQLIVMQLDSNGNLVLPPLLAPQGLQLFPQPLLTVLVRAFYPTFVTDPYPATAWQIWAGTTPPDTLTSLPIATVPVTGTALFTTLPSFPMPGKFYFAVGLYRVADGAVSTPITGSITLVAPPNELTAIPSGYEVLP